MKLQPATRREVKRISAGVLIGSALMVAIFAAVGKFSWSVVWGALLGDLIAIGNFVYLGLSVQKAAADDNQIHAKLVMRASYFLRMLIAVIAIIVGLAVQMFHWLAVIIPLLLPRLTILVLQITGAYKPEPPAAQATGKGDKPV